MGNEIYSNNGTSQTDRIKAALKSNFFHVDELTMESILSFIYDYSKFLKYYNEDHLDEENWSTFLEKDITVVLSIISCVDLKLYEEIYTKFCDGKYNDQKEILKACFELIVLIDEWKSLLSEFDDLEVNYLIDEINHKIQSQLKDEIGELNLYYKIDFDESSKNSLEPYNNHAFSSDWDYNTQSIVTKLRNVERERERLKAIYKDVLQTALYFQVSSKKIINKSIFSSTHSPHVGLLIAFTKLYAHAQSSVNTFSKRHLDFYYKDILQVVPNPPVADTVHLVAKLNGALKKVKIYKGTQFLAGVDKNNREIYYESIRDFDLNTVEIAKAYTLYIKKEHGKLENYISGIFTHNIILPETVSADPMSDAAAFPIVGSDRNYKNCPISLDPSIGFSIASSELYLPSGNRKIEVIIEITSDSFKKFINHLKKYHLDQVKGKTIESILKAIFKLEISTSKGWITVDSFKGGIIKPNLNKGGLEYPKIKFSFTLSQAFPSIIPFSEKIHQGYYPTKFPILKILIDNSAEDWGYSFVEQLNVISFKIITDVKEVKELELRNSTGVLPKKQPFYPFGVLPSCNSYFTVGCDELENKMITNLSLTFDWNNVPKNGLGDYYKDYGLDIKNDSFIANVSYYNEKCNWEKLEEITLFDEQDVSKKSQEKDQQKKDDFAVRIVKQSIGLSKLKIDTILSNKKQQGASSEEDNRVDKMSIRTSFLKIQLIAPSFAFAHKLYPEIKNRETIKMVHAISKGNDDSSKEGEKYKMFPEPFTPMINSISLNYSSEALLSISSLKDEDNKISVFYIHPFGIEEVDNRHVKKDTSFVPDISTKVDVKNINELNTDGKSNVGELRKKDSFRKDIQNQDVDPIDEQQIKKTSSSSNKSTINTDLKRSVSEPTALTNIDNDKKDVGTTSKGDVDNSVQNDSKLNPIEVNRSTEEIGDESGKSNLQDKSEAIDNKAKASSIDKSGEVIETPKNEIKPDASQELNQSNAEGDEISNKKGIEHLDQSQTGLNDNIKDTLEKDHQVSKEQDVNKKPISTENQGEAKKSEVDLKVAENQDNSVSKSIESIEEKERSLAKISLVPHYDDEGNLFLGLSNVSGSEQVNLKFVFHDITTETCEGNPPEVIWNYLDKNSWKLFDKSDILYDSTLGFLKTGIITLQLPEKVDAQTTLFDKGLFWIKAAVNKYVSRLSYVSYIKTQGIEVMWSKDIQSVHNLNMPLPLDRIQYPRFSIKGVLRVFQNTVSEGGRSRESEDDISVRLSERLAHKNKAVVAKDYENIILQQFPTIYKACCLENTSVEKEADPGNILIVVVPKSSKGQGDTIYPPRVKYPDLCIIHDYLKKCTSPFININVINPVYEIIQVKCNIIFKSGLREEQLVNKLNQEISNYISPWSDNGLDVKIGGDINRPKFTAFLMGLDFVKFVSNINFIDPYNNEKNKSDVGDEKKQSMTKTKLKYRVLISSSTHQINIMKES